MELQARAEGPQFAFGSGEDWLREGARVANGHDPQTPGVAAHGNRTASQKAGHSVAG
jgi:hypothetical protein